MQNELIWLANQLNALSKEVAFLKQSCRLAAPTDGGTVWVSCRSVP